jgi:hypothetical protein
METQTAVKSNKNSFTPSSRYVDFVIYLFCIAGMAISLNFFRLDLFRTLTRREEQAAGIITFKYKAAQRRYSNRILWDRLRQESPVYHGDFIRTAALSEATITFTEGSAINLGENSLIQLQRDAAGAFINIREGEISANADSAGLVLSFGDDRIVVNPGAVVNAGTAEGGFLLQVVEGEAVFNGKNGTETVSAGQIFVPGAGVLAEAAALSPRPAARLLNPNPGKLTIPFRWSRANLEPGKPVRFEIAEDREFTRLVVRQDLAGESTAAELDAGSYFWRIFVLDGENPPSPRSSNAFSLKVIASVPPALIAPVEGYEYQFRIKKPMVRFQWTETAGTSAYLVEAADNPEMEHPVFSREVWGTSFYSSELGPGTWYWQVQPVLSGDYQGTAGKGDPGFFRITRSGNLRAPVLRAPADRGMVNIANDRGDFYFSWQSEPEARFYTILISENQDLRDSLITGTVPNNFYVYQAGEKALKPGLYYWGVFQSDSEGNPSPLSLVRSFTAREGELIQRTVFPPDGYSTGSTALPEVQFSRQAQPQISDQAGFSRPVNSDTPHNGPVIADPLPVPPDNTGAPPQVTRALPLLPEAANRLPRDGTMINGGELKQTRKLAFSWDTVPGATGYLFSLTATGENNEILRAGPQKETVFILEDLTLLDAGPFIWRVEAVMEEAGQNRRENPGEIIRHGQPGENRFNLEFTPPDTPVLLKPGVLYGN